jgi:Putative Actinobacterial Holin-X, holin superfamily III
MEPAEDDRSLAALFTDFSRELSALLRKEVALARAEASEKITQVKNALISLGAGGVALLVGLYFLFQALALGLATLLANWLGAQIGIWLAPLLVGLLAGVFGWLVLRRGLSNLQATELTPHRTAETLRRDAQMVKEHTR